MFTYRSLPASNTADRQSNQVFFNFFKPIKVNIYIASVQMRDESQRPHIKPYLMITSLSLRKETAA